MMAPLRSTSTTSGSKAWPMGVLVLVAGALTVASGPLRAQAIDTFTGDKKLSCEAIMCLSSGTRPSECTPSLKRYFSISHRKWKDTIKARRNFLKICPTGDDPQMESRRESILAGADKCDAASLNATLVTYPYGYDDGRTVIDNRLPDHCNAYINHAYSYNLQVRYVGDPHFGGYWEDVR
jgi:hypothetical protein